jgi:hypothetical protein
MIDVVVSLSSSRLLFAIEEWFRGYEWRIIPGISDHDPSHLLVGFSQEKQHEFHAHFELDPLFWDESNEDWSSWKERLKGDTSHCMDDLGLVLEKCFYLLARVDEYFPDVVDEHGRFMPACAIQQHWRGVEVPYIDVWKQQWWNEMQAKGFYFPHPTSSYTMTVDVDSAYAYLHKGLYRSAGGLFQDVVGLNWTNALRRVKTWMRMVPDAYDTYSHIHETVSTNRPFGLNYFFLLADFGKYDKGLPWDSRGLKKLMRGLQEQGKEVGIHPGYASLYDSEVLKIQTDRFLSLTDKRLTNSRFHYLRMDISWSYRQLLKAGISRDFTMGFATQAGFRAGTSKVFRWFDLLCNRSTELEVVPFVFMDITLRKYEGLSVEEAKRRIDFFCRSIQEVEGDFCVLWHNESLSEIHGWQGWRPVFSYAMQRMLSR